MLPCQFKNVRPACGCHGVNDEHYPWRAVVSVVKRFLNVHGPGSGSVELVGVACILPGIRYRLRRRHGLRAGFAQRPAARKVKPDMMRTERHSLSAAVEVFGNNHCRHTCLLPRNASNHASAFSSIASGRISLSPLAAYTCRKAQFHNATGDTCDEPLYCSLDR